MSKGKVLIIDDEATSVMIISHRLKFQGYEVLTASDGEEGLAMARSQRPDLIISDVMMPVKNGFQVCKELRSEGIQVPFIFLTSKEFSDDQSEGFHSGADDYISKPFDPLIIEAKVAALLRRLQPPGK